MSTFTYHGQRARIDTLYSYARVSSTYQGIEAGGEGIPRQIAEHMRFAAEYGIPTADTDLQFVDDGLSGSKGAHLRAGGALAAFMRKAKAKELGPYPGLTVESFSRLSRLPINRAIRLFLDIIDAGVVLITLTDGMLYSQASVQGNDGQMYQVTAGLQAAHAMARSLSGYAKSSWINRRGTPAALAPAWFDKFVRYPGDAEFAKVTHFKGLRKLGAQLEVRANPVKVAIIQRIFTDALTIGVDEIARRFNREGVPTLSGTGLWGPSVIAAMIRGRMVLGEQIIGRQVDREVIVNGEKVTDSVRVATTECSKGGYPAVVSEDEWKLANAALDSRVKGGVRNGRNATKMTNLFGDLAVCDACGGRMKVTQKGTLGQFKYFGCSRARSGLCDVTRYHRLDKVETCLFDLFEEDQITITDSPVEDKPALLAASIVRLQADADKIFRALKRAMLDDDDATAQMMIKDLRKDHAAKLREIETLDRERVAAMACKPRDANIATVRGLGQRLGALRGDALVDARTQIAAALPAIVSGFRFCADGSVIAGVVRIWPERPIGQQIASLGLLP